MWCRRVQCGVMRGAMWCKYRGSCGVMWRARAGQAGRVRAGGGAAVRGGAAREDWSGDTAVNFPHTRGQQLPASTHHPARHTVTWPASRARRPSTASPPWTSSPPAPRGCCGGPAPPRASAPRTSRWVPAASGRTADIATPDTAATSDIRHLTW